MSRHKKIKQAKNIANKDRLIAALTNAAIEQECELLSGRLLLAMQK